MRSTNGRPANSRDTEMTTAGGGSCAGKRIAGQFADSIDQLYQSAKSVDPTPRSQIAYACYLAEHGQNFASIGEFGEILDCPEVVNSPSLMAEIVYHVARIQIRLDDDDTPCTQQRLSLEDASDADLEDLDPDDFARMHTSSEFADVMRQVMDQEAVLTRGDLLGLFSELDEPSTEELADLLKSLRLCQPVHLRRRRGLTLLRLALFCGRHNWCQIEAECIRTAIRCFEQSAANARWSRRRLLSEPVVATRLQG